MLWNFSWFQRIRGGEWPYLVGLSVAQAFVRRFDVLRVVVARTVSLVALARNVELGFPSETLLFLRIFIALRGPFDSDIFESRYCVVDWEGRAATSFTRFP
jgi:hypothetical protein